MRFHRARDIHVKMEQHHSNSRLKHNSPHVLYVILFSPYLQVIFLPSIKFSPKTLASRILPLIVKTGTSLIHSVVAFTLPREYLRSGHADQKIHHFLTGWTTFLKPQVVKNQHENCAKNQYHFVVIFRSYIPVYWYNYNWFFERHPAIQDIGQQAR